MMALDKVLFVTNHYPPDIGAASNRANHVVRVLRERGLYVDVVTSRPVYPNPELYHHDDWKRKSNSPKGEVRYVFALSKGYRRFPLLFRLINQLLFFFLASFYVLRKGQYYRLVVTSSPPFIVSGIGLLAKCVRRCKWLTEIRDLWPDSLLAVGKMSSSMFLYKLLKRLEYLFYRKSDGIVLLSPGMADHLKDGAVPQEKLMTITNGIPEWISKRKERYSVDHPLTIRYIGNIGHAQDFTPLLDMARRNPEIRFELIGEGMYKERLRILVERQSLSNVILKDGIVNREEILDAYVTSDAGYIGLKSHDIFSHVIPSKLFEYGATGVPILYCGPRGSVSSAIIEKYGLGAVVARPDQFSAEDVKNVIRHYREHADVQGFMAEYSWDAIGDRYYTFLSGRCLHERQSVHDSVESFHN